MDSDWAVFVEDNDNNRGEKYPFLESTAFNPGSINIFITICDYDEERKQKEILPIFKHGLPSGHPA